MRKIAFFTAPLGLLLSSCSNESEQVDGVDTTLEDSGGNEANATTPTSDASEIPEEEIVDAPPNSEAPAFASKSYDARPYSGETDLRQTPLPEPSVQATGATPRGNPGNWTTSNDYPSRALREEREGTTGFRVQIGPDGRVTECQTTSSSGHADLDAATCDNVRRRARFNPAMDSDGNLTTGTYSNSVHWVIPRD